MPSESHLIVGLGNPGRRYQNTWHNLGALVVQELARRWGVGFKPGRGDWLEAGTIQEDTHINLMLPTSYMNRSGIPVSVWVNYNKLPLERVVIIYDDHDLPFGKLRLRPEGSSGGHRGMEDIILQLNSDKIPRIRIGIRQADEKEQIGLADRVLSLIPKARQIDVQIVVKTTADAVELFIREGFSAAMNKFNGLDIFAEC